MKIVLFANTEWYLYNFRLPLAEALRAQGHEVVLLSPPGPRSADLTERGFKWHPLPMNRRSINPIREIAVILDVLRFFRREQPDIVHLFTIKCAVYGCLAAALANVPARVVAITGLGSVYSSTDFKYRLLRPLISGLMRFAFAGDRTRVILQNPEEYAELERIGVPKHRLKFIASSGVNLRRFSPSPYRLSSHPLRVLCASRLLWSKGIGLFIEAARRLKHQGRNFQFLLAGTSDQGNPDTIDSALIETWRHEGDVEILGHVEDMPQAMAAVDVIVCPSYYREGVPRTLIEACAMAKPIVTTDTQGCRYAVIHGENGLIVPPRNVDALVDALIWMDEHREELAAMGEAGRRRAEAVFDERIVIGATKKVYEELTTPLPYPLPQENVPPTNMTTL